MDKTAQIDLHTVSVVLKKQYHLISLFQCVCLNYIYLQMMQSITNNDDVCTFWLISLSLSSCVSHGLCLNVTARTKVLFFIFK